jgi:cysteine desulfurase
VQPVQVGGGQEHGMRSGTQNVPLIAGMAEALKFAQNDRSQRSVKLQYLRNKIIEHVLLEIPNAQLTGHPERRLPNHASFAFEGVDGNLLITLLDLAGFSCSSGSACKTGDPRPSNVLLALGLNPAWAMGSLRVTLGPGSTSEQIDAFLGILPETVARARSLRKAG